MANNELAYQPGFRGTETSSASLIIYPQKSDPIIIKGGKKLTQNSSYGVNHERSDFSLVSIATTKAMGQGAGSWQATVKADRGSRAESNIESITDDDWVDIVFYRHAKPWHVMRGLVDSIRINEQVGRNGVTVRSYQLAGRDFTSVFERTLVWFSPFHNELGQSVSLKVTDGTGTLFGSPTKAVKAFLYSFMSEIGNLRRAIWQMPEGIPLIGGTKFLENVIYNDAGFTNKPARIGISPSMMMPQGNIWQLGQEWSDPAFCELFCDTATTDTATTVDPTTITSLPVTQSKMIITFRDRPFPVLANTDYPKSGMDSAYFSLPLHKIPKQYIVATNIGKSGSDRFNAFFISPQMGQEVFNAGSIDLAKPLWNPEEIKVHGLRRYDISTKYNAENSEVLFMTKFQRTLIRDWQAINPYLWNGTISLGRGFPEIQIGSRVRVIGPQKPYLEFYVENVSHTWAFGSSIKTSLGVTRGWEGDAASYLDALASIAQGYPEETRDAPGGNA